jgi:hypothetical protein
VVLRFVDLDVQGREYVRRQRVVNHDDVGLIERDSARPRRVPERPARNLQRVLER